MRFAPGATRSRVITRPSLIINRRCSIWNSLPRRLCPSSPTTKGSPNMFPRRTSDALLIATLCALILSAGCRRSANTPATAATVPNSSPNQASSGNGIETEIVANQTIAGVIPATGKILVPEDRVATIGPVNEGRIVKLYAGQGTRVRKGQKLAELESADIDQAEADYLKAQADSENAKRSPAAEIKLAQQTYDRTKTLYVKTGVPGTKLQPTH